MFGDSVQIENRSLQATVHYAKRNRKFCSRTEMFTFYEFCLIVINIVPVYSTVTVHKSRIDFDDNRIISEWLD